MLMSNLIFTMVSRGWAWSLIRSLFGWLDSVAYFLFSTMIQLIFDIVAVTSDPAFNSFYDDVYSRIYGIIAIYMLFKITISMLTYLVNPDSMNDKERGVGKMATRVIVALVMLIGFPSAFQFINKVQPHIIAALPRIILKTNIDGTDTSSDLGQQMGTMGDQIAFDTYNGIWFNGNCADKSDSDNGGDFCFMHENTVDQAVEHLNDPADNDSSVYRYDYYPLIGFIMAIAMSIILLGYCVDIAIRTFKLIILQLIAPIPIISYIDPKSSKDGAFSKWIKMVGSVYLDVFIKLSIIYFIILVISSLVTSGTIANITSKMFGQNGGIRSGMVMVALVMGLFFFAKEAPKFITDALGIKSSENSKLFGGIGKVAAAATLGAGTIGSVAAGFKASRMADEANGKNHALNFLKNVGAGVVGGVSGFSTGAKAALNAKDNYAKATMDAMAKRNATALAAGASGSTFFGRMGSTLMGLTTGETLAASGERKLKALSEFNKALDAIGNRAKGEMVKQDWTWGNLGLKDANGNDLGLQANYKSFMAAKNAAASAGKSSFEVQLKDKNGNLHAHMISMETANMQEGFLLKNNEDDYIKQTIDESNTHYDAVTASLVSDAEAKAVHVSSGNDKLDKTISSFYVDGKFKVSGRDAVKQTQDAISMDTAKTQRENATNKANDRFSGTKNG